MKNLLRSLASLKNDKICLWSLMISNILIPIHIYQYIMSGYEIRPLIRLVFCCVYTLSVLFFRRKCIVFLFSLYAFILTQFITFQNYTPFVILVLASILTPKINKFLIGLYAIDAIVMFIRTDLSVSHILIHAINCFIIWNAIRAILHVKFSPKPLKLTEEETLILNDLRNGKQQKEIENFSKNTVTKYLRNAKERNNIATTEELLIRYCAEKIM